MQYSKPFQISLPVSNNSFDYDLRIQKNKTATLTVPALIKGDWQVLKLGQQIVFESFDDDGNLKSCTGLENFLETKISHVDCYIFDNHNHAFFFWHKHFQNKTNQTPLTLIHLDQHKDTRTPSETPNFSLIDKDILEKAFNYTNQILNVGNFIPPALHTGLLSEVIQLNSNQHLQDFAQAKLPENFIFDLDLDIFAPELNYLDQTLLLTTTQTLISQAKLITIATSPFFIDQNLALQKLAEVFNYQSFNTSPQSFRNAI